MSAPELHMISNGKQTLQQYAAIAGRIQPYASAFHLREKARTAAEIAEGVGLLTKAGVPLEKIYINDRVDVAWICRTKGVQLAYHSLDAYQVKRAFPALRVGCSIHSVEEAKRKEQEGADFLLYGHVFTSSSKPGLAPRGLEGLAEVVRQVSIPVIAIGGIKPHHIKEIMSTGASGIAVMSAILEADDPLAKAIQYHGLLQLHKRG